MKNEKIYSVFGQFLVMGVLLLVAVSIYRVWARIAAAAGTVLDGPFAIALATFGVVALFMVARAGVAMALLVLLTMAGLDLLLLSDGHAAGSAVLGAVCLGLAAVIALGMMSERLEWLRDRFPTILMVVLGIVFLAPVAIIGRFLQIIRILPASRDD